MSEIKRIGVLTAGGDCPGLNAVIRGIVKTAISKYKLEVIGIKHGYRGMFLGGDEFVRLDLHSVSGLISEGGTILYSSNKDNLFDYTYEEAGIQKHGDVSDRGIENMNKAGIDALIIIGGDGSLTSGRDFARKGFKVIGVPKTIDNDLGATDVTFGFDTAVSIATDSIDRLRMTSESHSRIGVAEIMGRYAGFLCLHAGIAGGADAILIPEIPFDLENVAKDIRRSVARGKNFYMIAVSEGAAPIGGSLSIAHTVKDSPDAIRLGGIANTVARELEAMTGMEARGTILGHVQRGGTPTAHDRVLSTRYGQEAVELVMSGKFGNMVTLKGNQISYESLETVIGQNKAVDPNGDIVKTAKSIGICFGD